VVLLVVVASVAILSSPADATGRPKVEYLGVSAVSTTSAAVDTRIYPEGSDTTYEFFLECQVAIGAASNCEPLTVGPQREEGIIAAESEGQTVGREGFVDQSSRPARSKAPAKSPTRRQSR